MKITVNKIYGFLVLMLGVIIAASCNKNFPNLLQQDYPADTVHPTGAKVLYIIMDGARGDAIQTFSPPNISLLLPNALYTWDGLVDSYDNTMTMADAWATQLTGVDMTKHKVVSNDFLGNNLKQYPGFITLLKSVKSNLKISAFSASSLFAQYFTQDADAKQTFTSADSSANDASVSAAAVTALQNSNPDLVLAQFHAVEAIGESSGYESTNTKYQAAVLQTDKYIGNIMAALKARPNFSAENWLVVITSGKGGTIAPTNPPDLTPFGDKSRDIFTIFYSPRFSTSYIQKPVATQVPYTGNAVLYTYQNNNYVNASLTNTSLYNIDTAAGSYTFQFLLKNSYTAGNGWPSILSKRVTDFSGPGWNMFLKGTAWWINTSASGEIAGGTVSDNNWHVLTTVFIRRNDSTIIRLYTDGIYNNQDYRTRTTDILANAAPLRIGRIGTDADIKPMVLISNLQIYNRAFSDNDVADLHCKTVIDSTHPYYNNLIGYWPGDESKGHILKERIGKAGTGSDFVLSGPYTWNPFSDYSSVLCPAVAPSFYRTVPNAVDIPFQIFQWLGIVINPSWNLDGKGWSPVYKAVQP
jgi:hypothetical protein